MNLPFFRLGALSCALAVVLGAFGAHALKTTLAPDQLQVFETAVRYQFLAALGLQLGALARPQRDYPLKLLLLGSLLFSGSLYLLLLTQQRWLGPITPLGGLSMIVAWLTLAYEVQA